MLLINTKARPTLGLLISHIDATYQSQFWQGMLRFCRHHDCDLIVYASRLWRGQVGSEKDQEIVYRLADSHRIDALCIDASAFRKQSDLDDYLISVPEFMKMPVVSTSIGGIGIPAVMPDNRSGIRQVLSHLLEVHGCRRIAFVGGPQDSEDARQRRAAFVEFVAENKLKLEPDWLIEAAFDVPSGRSATHTILDSSAGIPDAIVYASDLMALAGLDVLKLRNIKVPEQIHVTGFDDIDLSTYSTPALATVAQPIEAKAWVAGKYLLDAVNGLPQKPLPNIGVKFFPRASCGCQSVSPERFYGKERKNTNKLVIESKQAIAAIYWVTELLGSVLTLPDLSVKLERLIPLAEIGPVYVSLYEEATDSTFPTKFSYLVCAVGADGTRHVDPEHPKRYLSEQIVPSWLRNANDRSELFVQELYKAEKQFGFLVTDMTSTEPAVYMALRDHISEVLYNIQHVCELAESQKALTLALDRATESERQFRELAQSLPTFIMETGSNGTIHYLNDTAKNLLEVTDAELSDGLVLTDFIDNEGRAVTYSELVASVPKTLGYKDIRLVSRTGRKCALLMRSVELKTGAGSRKWSGLDYLPVLESFTQPDQQVVEQYGLTKREIQVLALEIRGLVAKEIAAELTISLSTVKGHLGLIYRKLGVGSRDQLFRLFGEQIVGKHGFESLVFSLLSEVLRR